MSWNLLVHNDGEGLGEIADVTRKFDGAFRGLEWESLTEAALPVEGGFRLELTTEDETVQDIYTHGGFNHIKELAALCKREGWHLGDMQEGEDIDLDDPQGWYDERGG
ncbi:MAG: hypothetical protein QM796_09315 [Chthoniobacteraceae bacterium]